MSAGANLGESLLRQGLIKAATLQELQTDVRQARLICPGCGLTATPNQLNPQAPLNCTRCQTTLILATGRDSRFDNTPGTGQWNREGPTTTGSNRHPQTNTPPTFVSTRSGSARFPGGSGSARFPGGSGSARFGSGSGRGQAPDPSGSMRFRHALEKPGGMVGEFELLKELGRGGMGVVYKARHLGRDELVALKVLLAGALASKRQLQRFQREISAMTQLDHPNIVTVKDVGSFGDNPFFTMELVEGRPLGDLVRTQRLSFRRSAEIAAEVARGLDHAHRHGVVHRDIKPDNILIELSGAALITDFGLVRHMDDDSERMTRSGALVGTPYYMSPEQARGKRDLVTGKTDIYALGIVLYYMTCNELPFRADTQMELISKIVSEAPAPPSVHKEGVPAPLERIILKCMAKEQTDRYDTAADLAADLDRYLEGQEVHASAPRSGSGGRLLAAAFGVLVLTLLGVLGAWWMAERQRAEDARLEAERIRLAAVAAAEAQEAERVAALDAVKTATTTAKKAAAGPRYRQAQSELQQALTKAIETNPDKADLMLQRGRAHEALHLFDEAIADYQKAWDLEPGGLSGTEGLVRKTWLHKRVGGDIDALAKTLADALPAIKPESGAWRPTLQAWHGLLASVKPDEMKQTLSFAEDARRQDPSNATAWAMETMAAMFLGDDEQALNAIRHAIEHEPKNPLHYATRATLRSGDEDLSPAEDDLVQALLLDPELTEALSVRSNIRLQRGDYPGAISDLERVVKAEPNNGNSLVMLARVYRVDGQIEKCDALLGRAEKIDPSNSSVYALKIRLHLERAEIDDALAVIRRAIAKLKDPVEKRRMHERLLELADEGNRHDALRAYADELLDSNPDAPWGLEALGDLAASRGRWKEAAEIYERCMRLHPKFVHVWERYIGTQVRLKKSPEELQQKMEAFLGQFPEDPVALCSAAQFSIAILDDRNRARQFAMKAVESDPQSALAWSTLALVEAMTDNLKPAYQAAVRATMLNPEEYRAIHIIAEVLLKNDKLEMALKRWSQAISINPFYLQPVHRVASMFLSRNEFKNANAFIESHQRLLQAARRRMSTTLTIHRIQALFATGNSRLASDLLEKVMEKPPTDNEDRRYLAIVFVNLKRLAEARALVVQILKEEPTHRLAQELLKEIDRAAGEEDE